MHKSREMLLATAVLLASWQAIYSLPEVSETPKEASCYFGPTAVMGQVPNPNGCNTYFMCYEDSDGYPTYSRFNCSMGHEGMLYWNFRKCECDYKENTECYDTLNQEHLADYYTCTCPLSSSVPFPDCLQQKGE